MLQSALRLNENEILFLTSVVTMSFRQHGDKSLLVLELCNHRNLTFTGEEAEQLYARIAGHLTVI